MTATLTPIRSIREACLRCAGGSRKKIRECGRGPESSEPCPLFPYRQGKNPARAGIGPRLTSESARSLQKRTSQLVTSERKKTSEGVRCGSRPPVDPAPSSNEIPNRQKRRIAAAARSILSTIGER